MAVSRLNRNFKTAVVNGEFEKAEKLYKEGADIDNMSLIIHLADSGNNEALLFLASLGANIAFTQKEGWNWYERTPLHIAAESGREETVKLLVRAGAEVDRRDNWGYTPLCIAANEGKTEVCRTLIGMGADPGVSDESGMTPLFFAAKCRRTLETIPLLLAAGADLHAKDRKGRTALSEAVFCRNRDTVKLLLELGADPNSQAFDAACVAADAVRIGDPAIVEMLIKAGARFLDAGTDGEDLILKAVYHSSAETAIVLLKNGSDPNTRDGRGYTPLTTAVSAGNVATVKALLEYGADPNSKETFLEHTAIYIAAKYRMSEIVSILADAGADPNIPDIYGVTPLMSAFPDTGAPVNNKNMRTVSVLLNAGADPNIRNKWMGTALHKAATAGHVKIMKMLLKSGADPEMKNGEKDGGMTAFEILRERHAKKYDLDIDTLIKLSSKAGHLKEEDTRKRVRTDYEFDI